MIMEEGLLALKWNNHKKVFFNKISKLRSKSLYSDVTLACDGQYYQVHKVILSACSDYFEEIFEKTSCKCPVLILKDIESSDLENLLNYMYRGEVEVKQTDLPRLIKAAECLKIKGLASEDDEEEKENQSETKSKKRKKHSTEEIDSNKKIKTPKEEEAKSIRDFDTVKLPSSSPNDRLCLPEVVTVKSEPELIEDADLSGEKLYIQDEGQYTEESKIDFEDESDDCLPLEYNSMPSVSGINEQSLELGENSNQSMQQSQTDPISQCGTKVKCPSCPKTFARKYNLYKHQLTHGVENPFQCERCPISFSRNCYLKSHMVVQHNIHVGRKRHTCGFCKESFTNKDYFLSHVAWNHMDEAKEMMSIK